MKSLFKFGALALSLSSITSLAAQTYYVDANASSSGDGTSAKPWKTIQTAFDAAHAGKLAGAQNVLQIRAGTYREKLCLEGNVFGQVVGQGDVIIEDDLTSKVSSDTIVGLKYLVVESGSSAKQASCRQNMPSSDDKGSFEKLMPSFEEANYLNNENIDSQFFVYNANNLSIENLQFKNIYGHALHVFGDNSSNISLKNNTFDQVMGSGIYVMGSALRDAALSDKTTASVSATNAPINIDNVLVEGNVLNDVQLGGFTKYRTFGGGTPSVIYDNNSGTPYIGTSAGYLHEEMLTIAEGVNNVNVQFNQIRSSMISRLGISIDKGLAMGGPVGLVVKAGVSNAVIANNTIENLLTTGIYVGPYKAPLYNVTIEKNLVRNVSGGGVDIGGEAGGYLKSVVVRNNLIHNTGDAGTQIAQDLSIIEEGETDVEIEADPFQEIDLYQNTYHNTNMRRYGKETLDYGALFMEMNTDYGVNVRNNIFSSTTTDALFHGALVGFGEQWDEQNATAEISVSQNCIYSHSGSSSIASGNQNAFFDDEYLNDYGVNATSSDNQYLNTSPFVDAPVDFKRAANLQGVCAKAGADLTQVGALRPIWLEISKNTYYLQLAEVEVFNADGENIVDASTATQSSNYGSAVASRAVDGNVSGNWSDNSIAHSAANDASPYWRVRLKAGETISSIKISNRTDCCTDRMKVVKVKLANSLANLDSIVAATHTIYSEASSYTLTAVDFDNSDDYFEAGTWLEISKASQYLQLAEVQVLNAAGENIIRSASATQSSDYGSAVASRALDGNIDGNWSANSIAHTAAGDSSPYWRVRLYAGEKIANIKIWNRTDCCADRMQGVTVKVANSLTDLNGSAASTYTINNAASLYELSATDFANSDAYFDAGAWLEISKTSQYLQLAEVQVLNAAGENIVQATSATQSSNYGSANASRAVDGNVSGAWSANSIAHTAANDASPYWRVRLKAGEKIASVKIWNRTDCCTDRMQGAVVKIASNLAELDSDTAATYMINTATSSYELSADDFSNNENYFAKHAYLQISKTSQYLQLAEVQVLNAAGESIVDASTVVQSSSYGAAMASRAIDGDTSGNWFANSIAHTNSGDTTPYWMVRLKAGEKISSIKIWNRTDCCTNRMQGVTVKVSSGWMEFESDVVAAHTINSAASSYDLSASDFTNNVKHFAR